MTLKIDQIQRLVTGYEQKIDTIFQPDRLEALITQVAKLHMQLEAPEAPTDLKRRVQALALTLEQKKVELALVGSSQSRRAQIIEAIERGERHGILLNQAFALCEDPTTFEHIEELTEIHKSLKAAHSILVHEHDVNPTHELRELQIRFSRLAPLMADSPLWQIIPETNIPTKLNLIQELEIADERINALIRRNHNSDALQRILDHLRKRSHLTNYTPLFQRIFDRIPTAGELEIFTRNAPFYAHLEFSTLIDPGVSTGFRENIERMCSQQLSFEHVMLMFDVFQSVAKHLLMVSTCIADQGAIHLAEEQLLRSIDRVGPFLQDQGFRTINEKILSPLRYLKKDPKSTSKHLRIIPCEAIKTKETLTLISTKILQIITTLDQVYITCLLPKETIKQFQETLVNYISDEIFKNVKTLMAGAKSTNMIDPRFTSFFESRKISRKDLKM